MKILHVEAGKHLYGGPRQVLYIAEGVVRAGHESVLVCPRGSAIGQAARERDVPVVETTMNGDVDLGLVWRLRKLIAREKPDVVHLHSRRGADMFGGLAAKWAGVPSVVSRRVDNPEPPAWAKLKYPLFGHVITISEGIRQVMLQQGVPPEHVSCVRSALEAGEFQQPRSREAFLEEFKLPEDSIVLGVVAQLIERKGHRFLIKSLPALRRDFPELRVILFGKGPEQAALEQYRNELGLHKMMQFAGFRNDIPDWLAHLDILVHPALMEGLGIALLQASAAGVPIVASRAGGIPEAVVEGETGLLFEPGDVQALEASLRQLLENPELCQRMGQAGVRHIEEAFSVQQMVAGNLAVYERLLA